MENIKCIIVDDEILAQDILINYVNRLSFLELTGVCSNAFQALEIVHKEHIDLIFLDVDMPQISGLDFAKSLLTKTNIIFTTAHIHYAFDGYELNIIDFLLKPIPFDRFLRSVNKVRSIVVENDAKVTSLPVTSDSTQQYIEDKPTQIESIYIKENGKLIRILFEEIIYISGFDDYIKIITNTKSILTHMTMKKIEEELPKELFVRVHRSSIAKISAIKAINGNMIELENKAHIQIGGNHRDKVLSLINIIN